MGGKVGGMGRVWWGMVEGGGGEGWRVGGGGRGWGGSTEAHDLSTCLFWLYLRLFV